MTKNVVLLARVDDPAAGVTLATFSTIVPIEDSPVLSPSDLVAAALTGAPPVKDWPRY